MKRNKHAPVEFGANSRSKKRKNARQKVNLEPRTITLSRDNFQSAIESFLRATDVIHDSENPVWMRFSFLHNENTVQITIFFKEDQKPTDQVVH